MFDFELNNQNSKSDSYFVDKTLNDTNKYQSEKMINNIELKEITDIMISADATIEKQIDKLNTEELNNEEVNNEFIDLEVIQTNEQDNTKHKPNLSFTDRDINRVIEMAWEDRTPFEAIEKQFGLKEKDVIKLMKSNLKESSYVLWRERVKSRPMKHSEKTDKFERRFKSTSQGNVYYHKTKRK